MPWCHVQAKAAQLQQGIKLLDDRIAAEVQLRQDSLLQQAESLRQAQAFMQARSPEANQHLKTALQSHDDTSMQASPEHKAALCRLSCGWHISAALHATQNMQSDLMPPSFTLQGMNLSVESLHATMQRVREEVLQPYATMRVQTMQMSNLHRTSDVLRHVLQRLKHIAKLRVSP